MLLKKMTLTDFLSVKGTTAIDIDGRVTIILGSNDHGKTNLLTAIQHLDPALPISAGEANWDATSEPCVEYELLLNDEEQRIWRDSAVAVVKRAEKLAAPSANTTAPDADNTAAPVANPAPTEQEIEHASLMHRLRLQREAITLGRRGVQAPLTIDGTPIETLPPSVATLISTRLPRVELFKNLSGDIQDSVTADQIGTEQHEFLQGIFFQAGINPGDSAKLFVQDDATMRALDKASETLDASLRRLWGQGTDLHFSLRHKGNTIEFLADDPAIKNRKARMSKRSAGVTQFFRASMILYARQMKHPASSYIYLFDEPGVYLHPQGQRDLMQVFEQLSEQNQIVYVTHSLFLLNQNYPERHRLLTKDEQGTRVDQKPYRANWRLATDALGVYLTANILFSSRMLLVEGDSDPLFIYELIRQLNRLQDTDIDLNALGIMSFYDVQNLRFLLQVFKREAQPSAVMVLIDGDAGGKRIADKIRTLTEALRVPMYTLPENKSIEDYCLARENFLRAVHKTIVVAAESEQKQLPDDLQLDIATAWQNRPPDETAGRWFKTYSTTKLEDEASKVALARNYVFAMRDNPTTTYDQEQLAAARKLLSDIRTKLDLPKTKAERVITESKRTPAS